MASHSSILAWRIPWTEEPGRLESMGSQESDVTERLNRQPPVTRLYKDEGRGQTQRTHHLTSSDLALWLLGLRTASGAEE